MRLSTVLVSSTLMFAGVTTTLAVERENMLVARFADSDFLAPVEARAYDKEPELYARGVSYDNELVARGNIISNDGSRGGDKERKYDGSPKYKIAKDDPSPQYELTRLRDKNWSAETGSGPNGRSDHRRSLSESSLHELARRRRDHSRNSLDTGANRASGNWRASGTWVPNRASGNRTPTPNGNSAYHSSAILHDIQTPNFRSTRFRPPPHRIIL
ncbi:hypothetical protein M378DRAFT_26070 [Amanita muscaria Koide BX008]|uniref:Uncharacterized protein n=1 Tax=Amanita muscaria (strain Koide BX008) TaxID=946122 RepID=A0A0C2SEE8_AMAMK|nr:hypothetical protein M378DRAFT_26070 [Amanita muscaria Koide BX008]